jgi:hypothetical protein
MPVKLRKSLKALKPKVNFTKKPCHSKVINKEDTSSQMNQK